MGCCTAFCPQKLGLWDVEGRPREAVSFRSEQGLHLQPDSKGLATGSLPSGKGLRAAEWDIETPHLGRPIALCWDFSWGPGKLVPAPLSLGGLGENSLPLI